MLCPRCDQQGEVVRARIIQTNEEISLCDECDALWLEGANISALTFVDFSKFMADRNLPGLWTAIVASGHECSDSDYLRTAFNNNWLVEWSGGRIELLPAPDIEHQLIARRLFDSLDFFVQADNLGVVLFAPLPVKTCSTKYREPDLIFNFTANHARRAKEYYDGADLVMEVVSPAKGSRERDYEKKRLDYAEAGIPEYWIVDPQQQRITVLALEGGQYVEHGAFSAGERASSRLLEGFAIDVDAVFAAAKA